MLVYGFDNCYYTDPVEWDLEEWKDEWGIPILASRKERMSLNDESPLRNMDKAHFIEGFNRIRLITKDEIKLNPEEALNRIEKRRTECINLIAELQLEVHALDQGLLDYEDNAKASEKKRIAEITKRYVPKVKVEVPKDLSNMEAIMKYFDGDLDKAIAFIQEQKAKRS